MIKEVPCMDCDGKGFIAKFSEYSVWSERCPNCGGTGIVKVPMTNSDRVRAMSDEELAVFLCAVKFRRETILNVPDFLYIKDALDWLQQLYEGE